MENNTNNLENQTNAEQSFLLNENNIIQNNLNLNQKQINYNQENKNINSMTQLIQKHNENKFHQIKQQIKQRIKNDHQLKKIQNSMLEDTQDNFQTNQQQLNQEEEEYIDNKIEAIISQIDEEKWKKINKRKHQVQVRQPDNIIKKTKSYDDSYHIQQQKKQQIYNNQQCIPIYEDEEINEYSNSNFSNRFNRVHTPQSERKNAKRSHDLLSYQTDSHNFTQTPIKIEFTNPYEEQEKLYQYIINKFDQQQNNQNNNQFPNDESHDNSSFSDDNHDNSRTLSQQHQLLYYQQQSNQDHFEVTFSQLGIYNQRVIEDQKEIEDEQNQLNNMIQDQDITQNNQYLDYLGQQIY